MTSTANTVSQENAIKSDLINQFQEYTGDIYYPFAFTDLTSVVELRNLFPNARLIVNDKISMEDLSDVAIAGMKPQNPNEIISFLTKSFMFNRTSDWRDRSPDISNLSIEILQQSANALCLNVDITFSTNPSRIDLIKDLDKLNFEFRISDFFEDQEFQSGIVYLRRPGWRGKFMAEDNLWFKINEIIKEPRYLLVCADQGYDQRSKVINDLFEPVLVDQRPDTVREVRPHFSFDGGYRVDVYRGKGVDSLDLTSLSFERKN